MSRLRAALQALTQPVETVTRTSSIEISDGKVDDLNPPENIDEYHDLYREIGLIRANINQFVSDVVKPGVRIEVDDDTTQGYFMGGDDAPDFAPRGGFLEQCGVTAGEKRQPFYPFLKTTITNRWARGTILHEYLKSEAENAESPITGFKHIRPETISARTHENTNVLVAPDETDIVAGHEVTKRDEAAAYVQFDDDSILGRRLRGGFERDSVPLSQNDVLKQVLDPDIGGESSDEEGVFGTSIIESIADDAEEYREIKRDRATAIKTKAYGVWAAEFNKEVHDLGESIEVTEWEESDQNDWVNELGEIGPGDIIGHDGSIDLKKFKGEVPELGDTLKHYVDSILTPLPAPKYTVGFETGINQFVTEKQDLRYERIIDEERQYQERSWTTAFRLVAERHEQLDPAGLTVKIEPEEDESPVMSLDQEDMERLKTYAEALDILAGPTTSVSTLISDEAILDLIAQMPDDVEPATDEQPLPEEDEQVEAQFDAAFGLAGDDD